MNDQLDVNVLELGKPIAQLLDQPVTGLFPNRRRMRGQRELKGKSPVAQVEPLHLLELRDATPRFGILELIQDLAHGGFVGSVIAHRFNLRRWSPETHILNPVNFNRAAKRKVLHRAARAGIRESARRACRSAGVP